MTKESMEKLNKLGTEFFLRFKELPPEDALKGFKILAANALSNVFRLSEALALNISSREGYIDAMDQMVADMESVVNSSFNANGFATDTDIKILYDEATGPQNGPTN